MQYLIRAEARLARRGDGKCGGDANFRRNSVATCRRCVLCVCVCVWCRFHGHDGRHGRTRARRRHRPCRTRRRPRPAGLHRAAGTARRDRVHGVHGQQWRQRPARTSRHTRCVRVCALPASLRTRAPSSFYFVPRMAPTSVGQWWLPMYISI